MARATVILTFEDSKNDAERLAQLVEQMGDNVIRLIEHEEAIGEGRPRVAMAFHEIPSSPRPAPKSTKKGSKRGRRPIKIDPKSIQDVNGKPVRLGALARFQDKKTRALRIGEVARIDLKKTSIPESTVYLKLPGLKTMKRAPLGLIEVLEGKQAKLAREAS